jgi:hypothetical protein
MSTWPSCEKYYLVDLWKQQVVRYCSENSSMLGRRGRALPSQAPFKCAPLTAARGALSSARRLPRTGQRPAA